MQDEEVYGPVLIRGWEEFSKQDEEPLLESTGMPYYWRTNPCVAKPTPTAYNKAGFYARSLDLPTAKKYYSREHVIGIIEGRGRIFRHTDGIVRVEWARILKLFVPLGTTTPTNLTFLYDTYQCEIVQTNSLIKSLSIWLETDGVWFQKHNEEVFDQYVQDSTTQRLDFLTTDLWGRDGVKSTKTGGKAREINDFIKATQAEERKRIEAEATARLNTKKPPEPTQVNFSLTGQRGTGMSRLFNSLTAPDLSKLVGQTVVAPEVQSLQPVTHRIPLYRNSKSRTFCGLTIDPSMKGSVDWSTVNCPACLTRKEARQLRVKNQIANRLEACYGSPLPPLKHMHLIEPGLPLTPCELEITYPKLLHKATTQPSEVTCPICKKYLPK